MWKVFSVCFNNSRKQDMAPANGCRREINCGCGGMCTAACRGSSLSVNLPVSARLPPPGARSPAHLASVAVAKAQ